jgi:hypothetical protein
MISLAKYVTGAAVLSLLTVSAPARAELSAQSILKKLDGGDMAALALIAGAGEGITAANVLLIVKGQRPLFCQPGMLALTAEQKVDLLRRYVSDHPDRSGNGFQLGLANAYVETFPCRPG